MLGLFQLEAEAAREADYIDTIWKQQGVAKAAEIFSDHQKYYPETQRLSQLRDALTSAGYPIPILRHYHLSFLLWKHTQDKDLHFLYVLCEYAVSLSQNVDNLRRCYTPFTEAVATLRSAGFAIPSRFTNQADSKPTADPIYGWIFDRLQF
jgi:hypothetical protein